MLELEITASAECNEEVVLKAVPESKRPLNFGIDYEHDSETLYRFLERSIPALTLEYLFNYYEIKREGN